MPKQMFVDFKAVKAVVTMEQVLEHYALLDQFKRSGDSLSGSCPIHKGSNPTQFRISVSKNIWHCFSECKHGGNVLDFIARMDSVSIHAAALKAKQRIVLLDTRVTSVWQTAHIEGSFPLPYYSNFDEVTAALPKDVMVVAYCSCPRAAADYVIGELRERDYLLSNENTVQRYELLRVRFDSAIGA